MTETKTYCDRCGKEIKSEIFPQGKVTLYYTIESAFGSFNYSTSKHELCGDCTKALGKFLKMQGEDK